jgi:hypothetical protein
MHKYIVARLYALDDMSHQLCFHGKLSSLPALYARLIKLGRQAGTEYAGPCTFSTCMC